ncbi:MAG: ribonuclease H-like domain-containing protein [Candidatus Aminicenantes bacterium]|nr:ribonuclease H-like domain-containing protein [Candidatus Aminicenantes bacterium]
MTDIKEKLEKIRQQRNSRSRADRIQGIWDKIEKSEDVSTRDKLKRLIELTQQEKKPRHPQPVPEPQPREPFKFFENQYNLETKYGRVVISSGLDIPGDILACLAKDEAFKELDLSTALFLDLETTGLSGGTGTVPFLVGLGYYRDDKFYVSGFFLGDLAEEEGMIEEMDRFFREMEFQSVVTYNGKAFDLPLLETRFILNRRPFVLGGLPHLDFLFPARSLWSHKFESCRLYHLARELVGSFREEDIPSAEIPWRYHQYLFTGNYDLVEPIIYHNQEDILSLLAVVVLGASILARKDVENLGDALDLFGAGKIMEKLGDMEKTMDFFNQALKGGLPEELSLLTMKKMSYVFKKNEDWDKAVFIWKKLTQEKKVSAGHLFSFRELAMYLEHREKNYEEARRIAEEGFVVSMETGSAFKEDFSRRMERLKRKIRGRSH